MPIETQPKVRILQHWFSEQILPSHLAKQFIEQEKSILDLIAIDGGTETRKEIINNARVTNAKLGCKLYYNQQTRPSWFLESTKLQTISVEISWHSDR